MFTKFPIKLAAIIALTAILTIGVATAAFGFAPADFQPKGAMYVTAVSATNAINTSSTSYVDVPGLSTRVTIPAGKVGDLVIQLSAEVNSPDGLYARARVDGSNATPGQAQLYNGINVNKGSSTHGFNYYMFNVGAGLHEIKIQWKGLGGSQFMSNRSMVVFANIRNP